VVKKFEYKIESISKNPDGVKASISTLTTDDDPSVVLARLDMHAKFVQVKHWVNSPSDPTAGEYQPYCAFTRQSLKWIRISYGLFEAEDASGPVMH
jgi:hypothetical protein